MNVDNNTLNVIQLLVVLKISHVEMNFLIKLNNLRMVIVAKHSVHQ
jgi:hypothetical protein